MSKQDICLLEKFCIGPEELGNITKEVSKASKLSIEEQRKILDDFKSVFPPGEYGGLYSNLDKLFIDLSFDNFRRYNEAIVKAGISKYLLSNRKLASLIGQ